MRRFVSLRRRAEFARMRRRGRRTTTANLTLFTEPAHPHDRRSTVGITVSGSVGNAVVRNLVRRRLAAIVNDALAGRRLRLLVIVRPGAAAAGYDALRAEVLGALDRCAPAAVA